MKRVAIIGVGLIGGSLGMALRKSRKGYRVVGLGRNTARLKAARRLGAVDRFTTDWVAGVKDADIVVICTPVDLAAKALKRILPGLKKGAVVTDAGSVKGCVLKEVNNILDRLPSNVSRLPVFVGSHPMAGSEKTGVDAARKDLFDGATVVLTPEKAAPRQAVSAVERLWKDAGARTVRMPASVHDRIVAATSHLEHALAFALSSLVGETGREHAGTEKLLAGSFRDMTRIAGSNAADWAVICSANSRELKGALDKMIRRLSEIRRGASNRRKLEKIFLQGKNARQKLLNTANCRP